jgi:hypothetical protein
VAFPFPVGVSGLVDPDDEPYIMLLELCAAARRGLGMPSYTRADLERLVALKDIAVPPEQLPPNVIRLPSTSARAQGPEERRRT